LNVVVDASAALKWFFRSREDEADVDAALELLRRVADGRVTLLQPPHFVAEVNAVLAREAATTARAALGDLLDIEMQRVETEAIYARALELSIRFRHHLFDTLYHAVALETPDALLVTADERYWRKARAAGRIVRLADFDRAG
jgi:predicted nucleic acid-binding protein